MSAPEEFETSNTLGYDYEKYRADTLFWTRIRQAVLAALDAIERRWGFSPTTAEIRKTEREQRRAK